MVDADDAERRAVLETINRNGGVAESGGDGIDRDWR